MGPFQVIKMTLMKTQIIWCFFFVWDAEGFVSSIYAKLDNVLADIWNLYIGFLSNNKLHSW